MVKKNWWIFWLLSMFLLLLSASSVFAGTPTTGFRIWKSQTTTDANKVWTISFNQPLLGTSVNNSTVYVTDSKQTKIPTTIKLSIDGFSVTVTPSASYSIGDYNIYITNGITSTTGEKLGEQIIVPFTVLAPSQVGCTNIVVTVTDDMKTSNISNFSGALLLEDSDGNRLSPYSEDRVNGKYTFSVYKKGDYFLKYMSVANNVLTIQSIKLPGITIPTTVITATTTKINTATKAVSLVLSTEEGINNRKSGAIGGSLLKEKWGVSVEIFNATTTWTTTTDVNGEFKVYLPAGSYTVIVDGNDNALYKKHIYKMTVTAGQMTTPLNPIDGEEPIRQLGLTLDTPAVDDGSGVLSGIDATTKEIDGSVNSDATVYIYDTAASTPVLITTAKPDKNGRFVARLPSVLDGKRLRLTVIDSAENVYTLDMASPIS